jgi:hypothetical protein
MGVTAQILKHMLGASEGWFAIDHPVLSEQGAKPGSKDFRLIAPESGDPEVDRI